MAGFRTVPTKGLQFEIKCPIRNGFILPRPDARAPAPPTKPPGAAALSIKVRVVSGCFHRDHSSRAYALIDRLSAPADVEIVEHESGPELLAFLAVGTVALSLTKSVIELITAIVKSGEGVRKGDIMKHSLTLVAALIAGFAGGILGMIVVRTFAPLTPQLVVLAPAVGAHDAFPHVFPIRAGFVSARPRCPAPGASDG